MTELHVSLAPDAAYTLIQAYNDEEVIIDAEAGLDTLKIKYVP